MSKFKDLRIVDNFYQTSAFFPMPTVLISTLDENNRTSLGAYSLVFPYYIAGKKDYCMLLECRNSSNTAKAILRTKKCSLNFVTDSKKYFDEIVRLGFPGETPDEKMKDCLFTLVDGLAGKEKNELYPQIVEEAFQVFECSWLSELDNAQNDTVQEEYKGPYHDFNGITSEHGAHFILKIDKILMKPKYHDAIINGVSPSKFPAVPVDYGYRDSTKFYMSRFRKPYAASIPKKNLDIESVLYACNRADDNVKFTKEAAEKLINVPRIFLKTVLSGCVKYAKENNITLIDVKDIDEINRLRKQGKK